MRMIRSAAWSLAILSMTLPCGVSSAQEGPPPEQTVQFATIVGNLERGEPVDLLFDTALLEVVAERAKPDASARRHLARADAGRTDKQIGVTPGSPGATSLVEKAGFSRLLSIALEHGAIEQEKTATSVSLSTTPYMLFFIGNRDTPENYQNYWYLRRLGVSAAFATDKGGETTANDLKTEDVTEVTARLQILGDRSTRSEDFQRCWNSESPDSDRNLDCPVWNGARPRQVQQEFTDVVVDAIHDCALSPQYRQRWIDELNALRNESRADITRSATEILGEAADQLIDDPSKAGCVQQVRAKMAEADRLGADFEKAVTNYTEFFMEHEELLTLSVSQHPIDDGTDYTDIKLVYDQHLLNAELTANAEVALNNEPGDGPKAGAEQDTLRDYGASAAMAWEMPWKPFVFGRNDSNPRPMMLTASGKFTYSEEIDDPIGSAQIKLDIPVTAGLTVPIAVTYASRTETDSDDQFVFNVGTGFDLDSVMDLLRAN